MASVDFSREGVEGAAEVSFREIARHRARQIDGKGVDGDRHSVTVEEPVARMPAEVPEAPARRSRDAPAKHNRATARRLPEIEKQDTEKTSGSDLSL